MTVTQRNASRRKYLSSVAVQLLLPALSLSEGNSMTLAPPMTSHPSRKTHETSSFPPKYVRWSFSSKSNATGSLDAAATLFESPSTVELQTAVTIFQRQDNPQQTIELHAQLHLADPTYFDVYNTAEFAQNKTAILFELLLDEHMLEAEVNEPWRRRVKNDSKIQASSFDKDLATQYSWSCQADAIDYRQPNWFHADLTRQEFLRNMTNGERCPPGQTRTLASHSGPVPLWKVVSKQTAPFPFARVLRFPVPDAAVEATTALMVGPPLIVQQLQSEMIRRRIFTNLFLPGDSFATWLRYVLWLAVPSPEVSVLLLDWSSSWFSTLSPPSPNYSGTSRVSRVAVPILHALSRGRLDQVRKLVFGQVVLAGHQAAVRTANVRDDDSLLIGVRNNHALAIVRHERRWQTEQVSLHQSPQAKSSTSHQNQQGSIVLLFGCNHCPDLHVKLHADGFRPVQTTWRTAWSVQFPTQKRYNEDAYGVTTWFFVVACTAFLVVSGADWIATIQEVGLALEKADGTTAVALLGWYLLRHVLLYVGLSKLVLDGELSELSNESNGASGLSE